MPALDLSRAVWRKGSRSNGAGGSCVEVALADRVIAVRDSKNPEGPKLTLPASVWSSFTAAIKSGTHDLQ